MFVFHQIL